MSRWIFTFRSDGTRELTEEERAFLKRRAATLRIRRAIGGSGAVLVFLGSFVCLAIAAGDHPSFWVGVILCVIGGSWLLSWASSAETRALLLRRALRLGVVEEFRRVPGDDSVGRLWRSKRTSALISSEDETPIGEHWGEEEKFEEALARVLGRNADAFVSVGRDGVPLWADGILVERIIQPLVWEQLDDA